MGTLFIVAFACLPVAFIAIVGTFACLGYGSVKAAFNIGRCGFPLCQ